ncbi:MAG: sulfotransferase [Planctomycetes bacterium]|nr:sulfotransferase [Planctomycetota bacterium]
MCEFDGFYCEVGAGRSGTNFLGEVLSSHPMLAYWRRPKYIWRHGNAWKSDDCLRPEHARDGVRKFIRRSFHDYMEQAGKRHLLVCTQANTLALEFVNAVFPDGKIIHIMRDGREVSFSQEREWQAHKAYTKSARVTNRLKEVPRLDWPAYLGEFVGNLWHRVKGDKYRYSWGPKPKGWKQQIKAVDKVEYCAWCWRECVSAARRVGSAMPKDRYFEIRFEDLIGEPERVVPELLEFMGLPPAKEVDEFIEKRIDRSRSGHWLKKIPEDDLRRVMPIVGDLCQELGYI